MSSEDEWDGSILKELAPEWSDRVIFFPECGSTNDEARKLGFRDARDLTVVLAEVQTAGRGRRGRKWLCPAGEGLAFSLIVRPKCSPVLWSRIALAAGLAVAEGLETFGVGTGVKWPNDVWAAGRKIGGILVESDAGFVVVGVGVNVNVREFPDTLDFPATSLARELGRKVSREEVLIACLQRLQVRLEQIGNGFDGILRAWSERCVLTGKVVSLDTGGQKMSGKVEGISGRGELLLRGEEGVKRVLQASEIRVVEG